MSAERTHGETQFIQRNSAPQNCAPGIAHSSSTLVNVHQVYLMCQATGLDNFHLAFSYPVFESSCTDLLSKVFAQNLPGEKSFSAPTEIDLRAEVSGAWNGHLQCMHVRVGWWWVDAWRRCLSDFSCNAERWQIGCLCGVAPARFRSYLLILTALRLFAVSCVFMQFVFVAGDLGFRSEACFVF